MRRATRQRWWLTGAVAVLAVLALAQYRHEQAQAPGTLLAIDPARVHQVTLALPGSAATDFHRRDGRWERADGQPADAGLLDDLVATAAAPVIAWRPASDFDATRIGLAPPQARLALDGTWLDFGTDAATGPLCYVRVGDRVALVPLRYRPRPGRGQATRLH